MKNMMILGCLILFFVPIVWAQEKIEAPIWNIGDKWSFTGGTTIEITGEDENSYTIRFTTTSREFIHIRDKSSLNLIYSVEEGSKVEYTSVRKRSLNFPFEIGKTWKDTFKGKEFKTGQEYTYFESYKILGWKDVKVKAGKFKTIKLEYYLEASGTPLSGRAWYWYSPDIKYFVKFRTDGNRFWIGTDDWELISFELKK